VADAGQKGGHGGGGVAARDWDDGVGSAGGGRRTEWQHGPNRAGWDGPKAGAQWGGGGQRAGWRQLLALRLNNEHPNCLKAISSDNGTQFRNASLDEFCLEHGIDQ
jgi:hypothetical protein